MSGNEKALNLASGQLISIHEASKFTPYSAEYLSLLARKGHLKAVKISRDWLTTHQAVFDYISKQKHEHQKIIANFEYSEKGHG